ncbi:MAG: hypothetical protein QOE68_1187 [Thermoanaerobaculia bacterium]|jgi:hypothetical protein|nr:hypothetical protein [Thermoanaerobaculia bacterium]
MSDVMQPVIEAEKQLADVTQRAIDSLLQQREGIDEKLRRLGHGKRGRKPNGAK